MWDVNKTPPSIVFVAALWDVSKSLTQNRNFSSFVIVSGNFSLFACHISVQKNFLIYKVIVGQMQLTLSLIKWPTQWQGTLSPMTWLTFGYDCGNDFIHYFRLSPLPTWCFSCSLCNLGPHQCDHPDPMINFPWSFCLVDMAWYSILHCLLPSDFDNAWGQWIVEANILATSWPVVLFCHLRIVPHPE